MVIGHQIGSADHQDAKADVKKRQTREECADSRDNVMKRREKFELFSISTFRGHYGRRGRQHLERASSERNRDLG